MRAFCRTLFGDAWNLSVVAAIMVIAVSLSETGNTAALPYLVPIAVLAGVGWLVRR